MPSTGRATRAATTRGEDPASGARKAAERPGGGRDRYPKGRDAEGGSGSAASRARPEGAALTALPSQSYRQRNRALQKYPSIIRPDGHYRLIFGTIFLSLASALGVGWFAYFNFYYLPDWLSLDTERLLRSIEIAATPVVWFGLMSNLCLMIAAGVWWARLHKAIARAAGAMELAGATVIGTLVGFTIFQMSTGEPVTSYLSFAFPPIFLLLSILIRSQLHRDGRDGRIMKLLSTILALFMFGVCQRIISGL